VSAVTVRGESTSQAEALFSAGDYIYDAQLTVNVSVALPVALPAVPVIVNGNVPAEAAGFAESVSVALPPPAATEVGENVAVTLEGNPEMLSAAELEFPATVTVTVVLDLRLREIEEGDTDTVRLLAAAFTVTVKVVLWFRLPSLPFTMIG
jgi:hypothetical protein